MRLHTLSHQKGINMNVIHYMGYVAVLQVHLEPEPCIHGTIVGIPDTITFTTTDPKDVTKVFHDTVGHYIAACHENGRDAPISCSGKLGLRVDPSLHAQALVACMRENMSLNEFCATAIQKACAQTINQTSN